MMPGLCQQLDEPEDVAEQAHLAGLSGFEWLSHWNSPEVIVILMKAFLVTLFVVVARVVSVLKQDTC